MHWRVVDNACQQTKFQQIDLWHAGNALRGDVCMQAVGIAWCQVAYVLSTAIVSKQHGVLENCFCVLHVLGLHKGTDPLLDSLQQKLVSAWTPSTANVLLLPFCLV